MASKGWCWPGTLILLVAGSCLAQQVVEGTEASGVLNWTEQRVTATGVGEPNPNLPENARRTAATESAKKNAAGNLLTILSRMALNSETRLQSEMEKDTGLQENMEAMVRNFRVSDLRYLSTGEVEVDVSFPLVGVLSDLLLPPHFGGGRLFEITQPLCPLCGQPWPEGKPVPPGVKLIMPDSGPDSSASRKYTGLIIDARGLPLEPALAPRIVNETGDEIYGPSFIKRTYAVEIGMVGYLSDLEAARKNERVRDHPLLIKAIRSVGTLPVDVVISNHDALLVHATAKILNFLERCRVIFVMDEPETSARIPE